jgi:hypothetical protein
MSSIFDNEIISQLEQAIDSIIPKGKSRDYPDEALDPGTFVRSIVEDRLGIITDAFYGDSDLDNKKIIIYTIMLVPDYRKNRFNPTRLDSITMLSEYEYDIYAYLMVPPVDLNRLAKFLKEPLL